MIAPWVRIGLKCGKISRAADRPAAGVTLLLASHQILWRCLRRASGLS